MPYVDNQGIRIHYQVEGTGPPLLMHHGSGSSLQDWYECGYVEALQSGCQLILIDSRGHGLSDKPHGRDAYELFLRVSDVVSVLDHLGMETAHYWGYSMGGWIGYGMAKYAPQRLKSLILGGAHPYAESARAFHLIDGSDPDAFVQAMENYVDLRIVGEARKQLLNNDLPALAAAMQDRESLEDILSGIQVPCFLYAGDNDPRFSRIRTAAKAIAGAVFTACPGLDHSETFTHSPVEMPQLLKFLQLNQ